VSAADARLDAAIALARRLAQAPDAQGAQITVSAAWFNGLPDALHGDLSIHVEAGTPAAFWATGRVYADPEAYVSFERGGRRVVSWRAEVEGVRVSVYCASPITQEAALG